VPEHLKILGSECNLPDLPTFYVNLHLPPAGVSDIGAEFARVIREQFRYRFPMAA